MLNRRSFIASALATGAAVSLGPAPASAQESFVFPPQMMPRMFQLAEPLPPGTIHVFPQDFGLYWSLPSGDGRVIRYSVGIGRAGLYETGEFYVGAKKEWPAWTPTDEMIERDPAAYEQYADGMPGGPDNPLGARALYLFQPQRGDTFLRIHGTTLPNTIGRRVSNGCVRLVNSHIIHLYDQVPQGTPVKLL
ncbi:L,D-transpeptidase family protein [Histidinibacterium aquaticum]|uniref:L,D-transpeptidase n=1 Tax=Histidinibacterium aquaticum TaxID=2613962 RepID=A0A5J5GD77_9RHOB|nr:L,D-transpeptidase family protein [Histidinibacterium aquaticum]KAA9006021.1 L,D-transpeptidase [Histidinibacterium aquaticum]